MSTLIKATSLRCFPPQMDWKDCIREARSSGYEGIEVNFDGRFSLDCSEQILQEIKKTTFENEVKVVSVYSRQQWLTPISSSDINKRDAGRKAVERLIEIAAFLEAPTVLTIPGAVDNSILGKEKEIVCYREAYLRTKDAIQSFLPRAERAGVILALENVPNKFLLSPLEFKNFIEEMGSKYVACHFDAANCLYYNGFPEDWVTILGEHIKAVHLKDYKTESGDLTGFCSIFEGDIDWGAFCRALAEINYNGALISEVLPHFKHHPEILWETASMSIDRIIRDLNGFKQTT